MIYEYRGQIYPSYLKEGNAAQFAIPAAQHFCKGKGLDVGCGKWPFPGSIPIEIKDGKDAMSLPNGAYDYIFSSHCLEHLNDPVSALEHWKSKLKTGGVLFLALPHPDMRYWRPQFCRRHRHLFWPKDTAEMLNDLGFVNVIYSERDLSWSFQVVGFNL